MSADLLREAAAKMRSDWPLSKFCPADCNCEQDGASYHPNAETFVAVAAWLDMAWAKWRAQETSLSAASVRAMSGETNEPDPHALAVARAYLRPTD